jgi:signal transduction histidine kinase
MGYDIAKGRTLTSGDISSASNVAIIGSDYITKNVEEIDERKLHLRLNIKGKDSISKMSQTFDAMLDKLETSFDSQKLFFQNASHELNTPLTIIKTNIDVLRQNKNATKEECEEVIDIIDNEVKKLSGISDSLLNLSDNKTAGEK